MATVDNRSISLVLAVTSIERQYGKGAIMRLGKQEPVPVEVIPSGALSLDLSLGIGGYPRGRFLRVHILLRRTPAASPILKSVTVDYQRP